MKSSLLFVVALSVVLSVGCDASTEPGEDTTPDAGVQEDLGASAVDMSSGDMDVDGEDDASMDAMPDEGMEVDPRIQLTGPLTRGSRYCELILARFGAMGPEAEVWGSVGLGDCPQEDLEALDLDAIAMEHDALQVIVNGPRYWIPNSGTSALSPSLDTITFFGDLPMHRLATITVDPSEDRTEYNETVVLRTTTYAFDAGEEIYELRSPDGATYVMQSMSRIIDPTLEFTDLPTLGDRLMLPEGWTYAPRTLESELVLVADGEAVVLTDDLSNTYQRQ